jgi:8-oxo-dGTP pyrophosphatase MutT (NUDIX family)
MVLIQRSTHKIVVIHESSTDYWFFPRGRKDLGETLEAAALREAYEEASFDNEAVTSCA